MPAHLLWQAEVLADVGDRMARRRRLEAVADAHHRAAKQAMRRGRG